MAAVEPIIVVLDPWCCGTSAVAAVLHHLGVFMGSEFDFAVHEPHDIWEDLPLSRLCRRAFSDPDGQLQMDADALEAKLRSWADDQRRAAGVAGQRPGVKNPLLCVAVDFIRTAWDPGGPGCGGTSSRESRCVAEQTRMVDDDQQRVDSTEHLIPRCGARRHVDGQG